MKVKEGFNMDLCLEVLQKHFTGCSIEKKSGIMGEYIDVKKSSVQDCECEKRPNNKYYSTFTLFNT